MDMSAACQPAPQPICSESERVHPRYNEYLRYRSAMSRQLVTAITFSLWLNQTEQDENGFRAIYEALPGAALKPGWYCNVFGPGHRLMHREGPFATREEAAAA